MVLRVRRLGVVSYPEAYALQRALSSRARDDYLLVLEHPHVYTLGVRADPAHVLADPESVGAKLVRTDRGGDVTYHGPGQLVLYPIVTLPSALAAGPEHVHRLEQVVIDALGTLGVHGAGRLPGYPGIWLHRDEGPAKVAAIGVRTWRRPDGRRRTMHGVALNVSCDLSMFGHIVPCGIEGLSVTSLQAAGHRLDVDTVADALVARSITEWAQSESDDRTVMARRPLAGRVELFERQLEPASVRRLRQAGVDPAAGLAVATRKPPWLRVPVKLGTEYRAVRSTMASLSLTTVCEEAGCPNIYECWAAGTATFMVNGSRCTRACGFCQVDTQHPLALDPDEPQRVGQAVARMNLAHAVVTCVARDDLADGGAAAIAATVEAIRSHRPGTTVETLISDCKGDEHALGLVLAVRPDVFNHNVETVPRLQRAVRPSGGYARSLAVLARAADAGLVVKSGLMVGLGESEDEVVSTLADLVSVGVRIATVGQYLRPSRAHLPLARFWAPQEFDRLCSIGLSLGLAHVEASPLTRSSYHAREAAHAASAR